MIMPQKDHWCKGHGRGCAGRGCAGRGGNKRGRGRPQFQRKIMKIPKSRAFIPIEPSKKTDLANAPIFLYLDELEAIRLVDSEGLSQDQAGLSMNISRGSIWRLLQSGRKKIIDAIFENREIQICNCTI